MASELKKFLAQQYVDCMGKNKSNFNKIKNPFFNNNATFREEDTLYCPSIFDGYLCWPETPANSIITQSCPDFVEGFSKHLFAHKTCLHNGSWYKHPETEQEWSNYTNCIDYEDLEFRHATNDLYIKGYAVSLVALIISLGIFLSFRSLKCTRIRIHVHLFTSLAFTCIAWISWYKLFVEIPENIMNHVIWCLTLNLLLHYLMLVNYFWMFCEALHLHLVLVVVFVKDMVVMRWFKITGWLAPIPFIAFYGTLRAYHPEDSKNCWMEESKLMWILNAPVILSLTFSLIILINVIRVLVKKLHPYVLQPTPLAIRKAVRATIILVPLFGIQHFLLPYRPNSGTPLERIYQIVSAALISLQGLCVSMLFCFANHDVIFAIRCLVNRIFLNNTAPIPTTSNTGPTLTQRQDL